MCEHYRETKKKPGSCLPQLLGLWIGLLSVFDVEAELGGDDHFVPVGSKRFAHQFLVRVRPIDFGGVEESNTAVNRRMD